MIRFLYLSAVLLLIWACQTQDPKTTENSENATTNTEKKATPEKVKRYDNAASSILRGVEIPRGKKTFLTSGLVAPLLDSTANISDAKKRRGDTYTQSINTLKRIQGILKEAGLGMKDVVYLRVYIAPDKTKDNEPDFDAWFKAYGEFFNNEQNPVKVARTTLGVYRLARPDILVEVEAVGIYPD
ncbi:MAG TPA: hypothetical protein DCS93_16535 [Microscillaceae bacterium]|nr:hypothetical protein [Microscillaceae bacterium]